MTQIKIHNGYIYIEQEIYSQFFGNVQSVVLVKHPRKDSILMMPVNNTASGGLLMKVKNSKGDRVVAAMDFLRSIGITDENEFFCSAEWDQEYHGLNLLFPSSLN